MSLGCCAWRNRPPALREWTRDWLVESYDGGPWLESLDRRLEIQRRTALEDPETPQHAPLRATVTAQLSMRLGDGVDVIGQLALQEAAHVIPFDPDQAQVRKIGDRAVREPGG